MIQFLSIFADINFLILLYIYIGYPILLILLSKFWQKPVIKKPIRPRISMLISCYNEENVIRDKLINTLELNYPKDKIEIIVVSDASTDRTEEIVSEYSDQGIKLIRQKERLGKTCGLNLALSEAKGEIIVFSDANAMYNKDALIYLVEPFADENVGYVVGHARYADCEDTASAQSENTYWNYESFIKKLESMIHSVVGGDGAIYAIRKELYDNLLRSDINDFVNPMQIISKGYRGIYEPKAICLEDTAGSFEKEFQRKVRIINRSFSGLLRVKSVLNPFKTGIFSLLVFSHKLLRWFASFFIIFFLISSIILSVIYNIFIFNLIVLVIMFFLLCAYTGYLLSSCKNNLFLFHYPYYFIAVNIASILGIFRTLKGEVETTWVPSRGKDNKKMKNQRSKWINILGVTTALFSLFILEKMIKIHLFSLQFIFWTMFLLPIYTYFGYPLVLMVWSRFGSNPIRKKDITPEVTMLICAYNEEEVIEEKIKNCFQIDYPHERLKIFIASDGSSDNTCEIVKKYTDDRLILFDYPKRTGKIGVINKTVPKLDGEIIIFSDANTMYDKMAIRKLVRNFYDPSVGSVSADVILKNEETTFGKGESLYYRYERWIQEQESKILSIIGADGGMYAIRRELFNAPSSNIILDDFVISMNVAINGYRLIYEKEAIGYEESTISYKTEFLRKSRVMAGAIQAIKQGEGIPSLEHGKLFFCYFSHKFLRWMMPICLIILLGLNILLFVFSEHPACIIYTWILIIQIIFYSAALCGLFLRQKVKNTLIMIPFYFCLENCALLYGIYKGITDKQSVKWEKFSRGKIQ